MTQERLAEKADLSTVFISQVECGHKTISMDALMRIAQALKTRLRDLLGEL